MGRKMTRRVPAVCSGLEPFQLAANEDRKGGLGWGQENSRIKKYLQVSQMLNQILMISIERQVNNTLGDTGSVSPNTQRSPFWHS